MMRGVHARSFASSRTATGVLCGAGAGALWGLVFLAPAFLQDSHPLALTIGRYLCYGLASLVLLWPRWRAVRAHLRPADVRALCLLALVGNVLYYLCLSAAVQLGGMALAALVIGFLPLAVTLIGSRDHGAVPLRRLRVSLLSGALGALCIGAQAWQAPGEQGWGHTLAGLGCALMALAAWTWFAVHNARHLQRLHAVSAHDWNLLTGLMTGALALGLCPLAIWGVGLGRDVLTLPLVAVSAAVALGASIVGNALWNTMSRLLPLTLVGQMILFETFFALLYGLLWTQRGPTALECLAFACVVTSVLSGLSAHQRHS